MTHQTSGQWDKEYPGSSGKMPVLTVYLAQTHSAQSCSFYGAL